MQAIERAKTVALRKSELQLKIVAVQNSFASGERSDELLQAQAAKEEAARIQAEAKARARVAQEAALLQSDASNAATDSYNSAVEGEGKLGMKLKAALLAFTAKVEARSTHQTFLAKL